MSNNENIELIKQAETEADSRIEQAHKTAATKRNEVDEKYTAKLAQISDTLSTERSGVAEKIQTQATEFKDQVAGDLKNDLANIKKGSEDRIKQTVKLVLDRFNEYVGQ